MDWENMLRSIDGASRRAKRALHAFRSVYPRLRTDEVSDEEVIRAIRSCPRHYAGISMVQAITPAVTSSGPLQSGAFPMPVTTGNTIIVAAGTYLDAGTVTDTQGNTYIQDLSNTDGSDRYGSIFRASNVVGGSNFKITITGPAYITFAAMEVAGLFNASPLDGAGSSQNYTSGGVWSTGAFSTSNAADLIVATCPIVNVAGTTYVEPAGFTNFGLFNSPGFVALSADYQIVSSLQTGINPNWTNTGDFWLALGVAYKGSATPVSSNSLFFFGGV